MCVTCELVGPARAGMIRVRWINSTVNVSWPRTSGDDPQRDTAVKDEAKLAPHERG